MEKYEIYLQTLNGNIREVEWEEINQLKKDILWIFDCNTGQLNASFVPHTLFESQYWEYLSLNGDFSSDNKNFYQEGALIIISCMITNYIDVIAGRQSVFGDTAISKIIECVDNFQTQNSNQQKLKEIVQIGLNI